MNDEDDEKDDEKDELLVRIRRWAARPRAKPPPFIYTVLVAFIATAFLAQGAGLLIYGGEVATTSVAMVFIAGGLWVYNHWSVLQLLYREQKEFDDLYDFTHAVAAANRTMSAALENARKEVQQELTQVREQIKEVKRREE